MLPQPPAVPLEHRRTEATVGHEIVGADLPERSLLDSRSFIFDGERLTDLDPDELALEILKRRTQATTLPA